MPANGPLNRPEQRAHERVGGLVGRARVPDPAHVGERARGVEHVIRALSAAQALDRELGVAADLDLRAPAASSSPKRIARYSASAAVARPIRRARCASTAPSASTTTAATADGPGFPREPPSHSTRTRSPGSTSGSGTPARREA